MVEKLRYTLIQFASMTANLMSNMKTRQASFNSFFVAVFHQLENYVSSAQVSGMGRKVIELKSRWKICEFFPSWLLASNDFRVQ